MANVKPRKWLNPALHIGVWLFLLVFPIIVGNRFEIGQGFAYLNVFLVVVMGALFYLNYSWLISTFYFTQKYISFVLGNVLALTILLGLVYFTEEALRPKPPERRMEQGMPANGADFENSNPFNKGDLDSKRPDRPKREEHHFPSLLILYRHGLTFLFVIGAALALKISGKWREEESKRKLAENEHLKSEMASLKLQLQPHFFFNTLNNIYALIDTNPSLAQNVVHKLAKLMRYVLYQSEEALVQLKDEVAFVQAYVEVMQIRYGNHVEVKAQFPVDVHSGKIPPLIFISLIENAFKHGVDASKESFIYVILKHQPNHLELEIKNSFFPKSESDESGSGIGLVNFERRLQYVYPKEKYQFKQFVKDGVFVTQLHLFDLHE